MSSSRTSLAAFALAALLAAGATGRATAALAQEEGAAPAAPVADTSLSSGDVVVQSLGGGDAKIQLVDHGDTWSMHAENVMAQDIFRLWHEAGGPEVVMKTPLDYPFTLSVHRQDTERIVERILEGWGRTLHYDAKGRLVLVRSYSPKPARIFKTPRLVESLGTWRQEETSKAPRPDGSSETAAPTAPPVVVAPPAAPPMPRPQPVPEAVDDPMNPEPEQ